MKERARLLRIRPFNMANFSGAGGYIPFMAIYGAFITVPATLLLWAGLAASLKKEDGKLNYSILKRRLNIFVLPICLAATIPWIIFCYEQISFYGSGVSVVLTAILVTAVHTVGMYFTIYFSAQWLEKRNDLTKKKWFLYTLLCAVLLIVACIIVTFALMAIPI